ncbi:MAG: neutral/alkaline non-lysosomal ceramidase N-terminal domain-containing protein [Candidatus Zipacnadales bacterium]
MEVGYGRTDISPEVGTPCALGIDNACEEVFDPLYAICMHLRHGEEAVAVVAVDVVGLYGPETRELQQIVAECLDLEVERVLVHATHTHQSPGVRECVREVLDEFGVASFSAGYFQRLKEGVVQAAETAAETTPVQLRVGAAMVELIASNRRCLDARGRIRFRASRPSEEMRAYPEGYIDPFVRVISFEAEDGRQWAILSYACHPTATGGDEAPYATADFPGCARVLMETERAGLRTIYLTGPCGNVNPGKWVGDGSDPEDRKRDRDAMGQRLAEAAQRALERAEPIEACGLRFIQERIRLPLKERFWATEPLREQLEQAVVTYRERKAQGESSWGGFGLLRIAAWEAIRRQAVGRFLETCVSAIGLGDGAVVFMPGESFLEAGQTALQAGGGAFVIPVENVDYTPSYIPTPESYALGGYEVEVTPVSPLAFRIEAAAVTRVTRKVLGK